MPAKTTANNATSVKDVITAENHTQVRAMAIYTVVDIQCTCCHGGVQLFLYEMLISMRFAINEILIAIKTGSKVMESPLFIDPLTKELSYYMHALL